MLENQMSNLIVHENVLYLVAKTNIFNINIPARISLSPLSKLNKTKYLPPVEWLIPKPSISYLYTFLDYAGQVYNNMKAEMEAFVLWNTIEKKHVFYIPDQTVSGSSCKFEHVFPEKHILLLDMHSHHTMSCSFSSIDDANDSMLDLLPHISLVVKNIDKFDWTNLNKNVHSRLTLWDNVYDLSVFDIFTPHTYPKDRIHEYKMAPVVASNYGGIYNNRCFENLPAVSRKTHEPNFDSNDNFIWDRWPEYSAFNRMESADIINREALKLINEEKTTQLEKRADGDVPCVKAAGVNSKSHKNKKRCLINHE